MKNNRNLSRPLLLEIFCSFLQVILRQTETRAVSELIDVLSPVPPITVRRTPRAPYIHLHLAGNLVTLKTGGLVTPRYLHPSDRYLPRHGFTVFWLQMMLTWGKAMANYPQELAQDAVCQSHTGHMTGLCFLPTRPLRLNTNE